MRRAEWNDASHVLLGFESLLASAPLIVAIRSTKGRHQFGLRRFIAAFPSTQLGKSFLKARCERSSSKTDAVCHKAKRQ